MLGCMFMRNSFTADALLAGGGGGGGGRPNPAGTGTGAGGGGGGGVIDTFGSNRQISIVPNRNNAIVLGGGGVGHTAGAPATNGGNTTLADVNATALGGGRGGCWDGTLGNYFAGLDGGAGGGGTGHGATSFRGLGTPGQGFNGGVGSDASLYAGGGGGGAGTPGNNATAGTGLAGIGGNGKTSSIDGASKNWAAGGGGNYVAAYGSGAAGAAGSGTAGYGNGGNAGGDNANGNNGAQGGVIIRYPGPLRMNFTGASNSSTVASNGDTVHKVFQPGTNNAIWPGVQAVTVTATNVTGTGATLSSSVSEPGIYSNSLIIVCVFDFGGVSGSVTDSAGNIYTQSPLTGTGGGVAIGEYYCTNCKAVPPGGTVTFTKSNAVNSGGMTVSVFTGFVCVPNPADTAAWKRTTGPNTGSPTGASNAPAEAGELFIGILFWHYVNDGNFYQASGWAFPPNGNYPTATTWALAGGWKINSGTGIVTYNPGVQQMDANYFIDVLAFKVRLLQ